MQASPRVHWLHKDVAKTLVETLGIVDASVQEFLNSKTIQIICTDGCEGHFLHTRDASGWIGSTEKNSSQAEVNKVAFETMMKTLDIVRERYDMSGRQL